MFQRAKRVIPGGVNSPVRAFGSVGGEPVFIKKAKGSKIYDINGKEYIDYVCSWGPMITGHADDEILTVIKEAANNGTSFGAPTEAEVILAELVVEMFPSIDLVRMVSSGTEAVMSAIRLARGFTGKDKIIKFEGCYHGHSDSLLVKAGSGALTFNQPSSPGVPADFAKHTLIAQFNDLNTVENLLIENKDVACVIVEPVAGNMGVVLPKRGFLEGLRKLCDKYGALLIFDEVITGFRISSGGAQKYFNVMPDITTLGKILGAGLPVGAFGGKKEIMEMMSPVGPVYQAGTLSGNPLAMAAGICMLKKLREDSFYVNLKEKSDYLWQGFAKNCKELGLNYAFNSIESLGCMFFTEKNVSSFSEAVTSDTNLYAQFFHGMLENGVNLAPSQFECMFVSSAHSYEDLDKTIDVHYNVLKSIIK
jgi:glutamate-1-semialdehyde 2,1-aminomutase